MYTCKVICIVIGVNFKTIACAGCVKHSVFIKKIFRPIRRVKSIALYDVYPCIFRTDYYYPGAHRTPPVMDHNKITHAIVPTTHTRTLYSHARARRPIVRETITTSRGAQINLPTADYCVVGMSACAMAAHKHVREYTI